MTKLVDVLKEELKKSFYSEREAKILANDDKKLSTSTPAEITTEDGIVTSNLNQSFSYGFDIALIVSEKSRLIDQWRHLTYSPEVDDALGEIINEVFVFDETGDRPFELDIEDIEMNETLKKSLEEAFEKVYNLMKFKIKGEDLFKRWYVDGSLAFEVIYNNAQPKLGIRNLEVLPPKGFYGVIDPETKQKRYFLDTQLVQQDGQAFTQSTFTSLYQKAKVKYIPEQIAYIDSGIYSKDRLFSISNLQKAAKVVNDLNMIEESLIIYRWTRSPSRNAIYVDTGRMTKTKAEQYIKQLMTRFRNKITYNTATGEVENRKKSIPMQEDMWFAVNSEGRGTKVERLEGSGMDVGEIADLDYMWRKLWRALNVPVSRRDPESRGNSLNIQNIEIENEEIKFFKFILNLRKRFMVLFTDLLKKELIITKVFALNDWNDIEDLIKYKFKNNNDYARLKKLQNLEGIFNIADSAFRLYQEGGLISKQYIASEILGFTEEEMNKMSVQIQAEKDAEPKEEGGF